MFDANLAYLPPGSRFFARITSLDTKHPLFEAGFRNNALVFGVKPRSQTASDPLDFHGGTVELTAPDGKVVSVQDDSECFSPAWSVRVPRSITLGCQKAPKSIRLQNMNA